MNARTILTAGLFIKEPNRSICGRCRGKGFDCYEKCRASRTCPQCKGAGSVRVGSTKR